MSHPIHKIIRTESKDYIVTGNENMFPFDLGKKEFTTPAKSILQRSLNRIIPKNTAYYITNLKEVARGNLDIVWENDIDSKLPLKIHYALKIDSLNQQGVIQSLQGGISIADSFERQIRDFTEEFYEEKLDLGVDPVLDYFKVSNNDLTLKNELEVYLSNKIETQIGFKVRSIKILELIDAEEQLEVYEIKKEGDHETIDIKLKDFRETLKVNYEVKLKVTKEYNKVQAIVKRDETHKFLTITERCICDFLLEHVTLEAITKDRRGINEMLKKELNIHFREFGREVSFFDLSINKAEQISIAPLSLIKCSITTPIKGLKDEKLILSNKIALRIVNHAIYKESKLDDVGVWIEGLLRNIIERDVITFSDYKAILIDNLTRKDFQIQIKKKLSIIIINYGLEVEKFSSRILNIFKLPAKDEPIHHEVECKVKGSDELILFGNTISITLIDKSKFIKNIPLRSYSKSGNYFNEWLKSELDIIVKRIIEFKDYRTIVLESAENHFDKETDDLIIDNKKSYKVQIKEAITKKAYTIGCKVSQLLIEPDLPPLLWLEENTISFDDEFQTERDGLPLKFKTTITFRVNSLEKLAPELIRPNLDINERIQRLAKESIAKMLLTTSSERAYLEFYETKLDGEMSVEEELKSLINKELYKKFNTYISFVNFNPLPTPFLDNYKILRNIDGVFEFVVFNNSIEIPIFGNFEVEGVSDWNRYKAKIVDAEKMIERIKTAIISSLKKRLERVNLNDIMMVDFATQFQLEVGVNQYLRKVIPQRFGLFVKVFDLNKRHTLIDQQAIENTKKSILEQGRIDLESKRFLLGEDQKKINSLFDEKRKLENKVKFNLAKEKDVKRLKQVKKKIKKLNQKQNLGSLVFPTSQLKSGNSIDEIFKDTSSDQKKLE